MNDDLDERPVMLFDGDCAFCRVWVERGRKLTQGHVVYRSYQEAGSSYPMIKLCEFQEAVQWVELVPEGKGEVRVLSGADAVFRALEFAPWPWSAVGRWVRWVPGGLPLSRWFYGVVARHRAFFSRWTCRACKGR